MFNKKSILITGGTGSLGKALTKKILEKYPDIGRLVIFSRDEQKQFVMAQEYPPDDYPMIRFSLEMSAILNALSAPCMAWIMSFMRRR